MYNIDVYLNGARGTLIPCECDYCGIEFSMRRTDLNKPIKNNQKYITCGLQCRDKLHSKKLEFLCSNCGTPLKKKRSQSKSNNHFCCKSCSATFNNTHKTHGTRRSKLECWLESKLSVIYSNVEIQYGRKDKINSELDIYIPIINLAFELNGIFHYEPIFGINKLDKIQTNDNRKFQACLEHGIELCIIDTSSQKYFKESTSEKFLDIITSLVNMKLSSLDRVEVL